MAVSYSEFSPDELSQRWDQGEKEAHEQDDGLGFYEPVQKLSNARDVFLDNRFDLKDSLEGLVKIYRRWVDEKSYLCNKYLDHETNETKYKFQLAPKRGNEKYVSDVKSRIYEKVPSTEQLEKEHLLADEDGTNVLHITLTVDPKQFLGDLQSAWANLPYYLNKFLSAFRQRYGRCWVLRSFEAQENGFPHIHLFIISEQTFSCEWYKGEKYWRWLIPELTDVHNATNLKGHFVNGFENLWRLGFVYARGVGKRPYMRKQIDVKNYVVKDVVSDISVVDVDSDVEVKNPELTLALNWLFRRQAFSISGSDVLESVFNLIPVCLTQTEVLRNAFLRRLFEFSRFEFLGFCGIVRCSEPPPNGFIKLSRDQEHELEAQAIGVR